MTFGRTLAALRTAHGWTQAELAEASGVDKAQISRYERDVDRPSFRTHKALLEALHVSPEDLHRFHAVLERIVTGRRPEAGSVVSSTAISHLVDLLGVGGRRSGLGAGKGRSESADDEEVERLAREAGAAVERLVRLHFARLGERAG